MIHFNPKCSLVYSFFPPFFFVCVRTLRWHCIGLCPFERLHNDIYKNTIFAQNRLKTTKYLRLISSVKLPFVFKCINCIFYWCKRKRPQSIDCNKDIGFVNPSRRAKSDVPLSFSATTFGSFFFFCFFNEDLIYFILKNNKTIDNELINRTQCTKNRSHNIFLLYHFSFGFPHLTSFSKDVLWDSPQNLSQIYLSSKLDENFSERHSLDKNGQIFKMKRSTFT